MQSSLKFFLILSIVFFILPLHAQQAAAPLPAPVKITTVEGITEYKLANGLHVLLFPDPSKPTITVNITYAVGSRLEGYGETGMAHLLEHMLFKGSKGHPNVPQELTAHGANPNGDTEYDRTNYFETFSATDENLKWALDLESDRMVNSFIAKKDLESEFSVVRNEFEMDENNSPRILRERILSTAYLWHNYGKTVMGSKSDIEKVPIENLQAFYHKYYQPDNAVLMVAGKIDEAKTLALVNQYFGKIPRPKRKLQEAYTVEPIQDGERYCELRRSGDVQVVACAYHICNGADPDYAPLDILADVLTNEPSGRLYKALVETKKATEVSGYAEALYDPGIIYFSADVLKEKSLDDAKKTFLAVFDSLKYKPVTPEEVDRARNKRLKDFDLAYNSSEYVGLTLSEYIAQGDWRLWFLYRDRIEKVSADDVNRVVKDYLKPTNRTVGVFIPEENSDRAQIPPRDDAAAALKDYKGKEKLEEAENFDPSPANIDKRTKTGDIPGGAKYALLNKTTRGGAVSVNITLRIGARQTLRYKMKTAEITANMLTKGTPTLSAQRIADAFDKLKADVHIFSGGQDVSIQITTVHKNLVATLQLVDELLHNSVFPADEFEKVIQQSLEQIDQQKTDPGALASNRFDRILNPYPADDFRRTLTFDEQTEALNNVNLVGVKMFYKDFYNSAHATAAAVGEFDEDAVIKELTNMLQNWDSPVKFERAGDEYFPVLAKDEKINTPDKTNANLMAGYNFEMRDDDPDYPTLLLGNFMLGGGFLNSRLAERIRQKDGVSYGVGSWVYADAQDKLATFGSYAIYNPVNSVKLITDYKEELSRLLDKGYTEAELKDARAGYLQERKMSRANDQGLAYRLSYNLYLGRHMSFSGKIDDKISTATLDEVNTVMRKYLKPDKITYVQAGDFESQNVKK